MLEGAHGTRKDNSVYPSRYTASYFSLKKTQKGELVDMAELHKDNIGAERRRLAVAENHLGKKFTAY